MDGAAPKGGFGRHRKIMPFEPGSIEELREGSRQKAASLNQHVLGYGAQAEAELVLGFSGRSVELRPFVFGL